MNKEQFLRSDFPQKLRELKPEAKGIWGKMNAHQMVEHMADAFRMANGKIPVKQILTPEEKIPRVQEFVMSDIPFKENTKNALLPDEPLAVRTSGIHEAIDTLESEIKDFFKMYDENQNLKMKNPFFGELDRTHHVSLLHKHAVHHLKQFGIEA